MKRVCPLCMQRECVCPPEWRDTPKHWALAKRAYIESVRALEQRQRASANPTPTFTESHVARRSWGLE